MHFGAQRTVAFPSVAAAIVLACAGSDGTDSGFKDPALGNLVVDSDRNGLLEAHLPSEQSFEDTWDAEHGAVFMANVDDDDDDGVSDHLDEVVNGPDDGADLARIQIVGHARVPPGATGTLSVDPTSATWVRLFRVSGEQFVAVNPSHVEISEDDLREGVELAIEAKFFASSLSAYAWSGLVDIEHVVVKAGVELARDLVKMRVAPLIFTDNTMRTERVWVGDFDDKFVDGIQAVGAEAQIRVDVLRYEAPGYKDHDHDPWTQDHFEMGYAAMPAAGGLHVMQVAFRTPRVNRTSADIVFVEFLGPDIGAIHVHAEPYDDTTKTFDSTGNWETIPPYRTDDAAYPHGRVILGSGPERHADPVAEAFMEAQRIQPIIRVDTSWLTVGHVDEVLSFVPADNRRGWQMLFARPALARHMLERLQAQGHGSVRMHEGKWWLWGSASVSIDEVLSDADLMATNQEDQVILDGILTQLKAELDLTDDEVTYMPFLEYARAGGSVAYQPGSVNLMNFDRHVAMADPFGPKINGVDPFKQDLSTRLGELGLTALYVDDWDTYHRNNGEVHCGTNAQRAVPMDDSWWEDGR